MHAQTIFKTGISEWLIRITLFLVFLPNVFLFAISTANMNAACGYYGIDPNGVQYSLIILYVTFVSYYPLEKRFSGYFQTRDYLILSVLLEVIMALVSFVTKNYGMLILTRCLQGLTTCNIGSVCVSLIFSRLNSDRALKIGYSIIYGVLLCIFPLITFVTAPLIDAVNYNYIYLLTAYLFIPGVILLATIMNAGNLHPKVPMTALDWPSALFLFVFLSATGFSLVYGQQFNWLEDQRICIAICLSFLGFGLFALRQHRCKTPYLDLRIFRYRNYFIGFILIQLLYLAKGAFNFTASYFTGVLGMSPLHSGRLLLFNILGVIIGSLVSSRMIQRRSYRLTWIIGFSGLLCYYLWMEILLATNAGAAIFIFPLLLQGFGTGMLLASIVTFMIVSIPVELGLSGITLGIMGRFISTCISTAVINNFQLYSQANHFNRFNSILHSLPVFRDRSDIQGERLLYHHIALQIQLRSTMDYYYFISCLLAIVIIFIAIVPLIANKKNNIDPVDNLPI